MVHTNWMYVYHCVWHILALIDIAIDELNKIDPILWKKYYGNFIITLMYFTVFTCLDSEYLDKIVMNDKDKNTELLSYFMNNYIPKIKNKTHTKYI